MNSTGRTKNQYIFFCFVTDIIVSPLSSNLNMIDNITHNDTYQAIKYCNYCK